MPKLTQLQRATVFLMATTLAIRGVSLIRDSLIANLLGASPQVDNFYLLLDLANFATTLIATTTINLFVPRIGSAVLHHGLRSRLIALYTTKFYTLLVWTLPLLTLALMCFYSIDPLFLLICCFIYATQSLAHYYSAIINLEKRFIIPSLSFAFPVLATLAFFTVPIEDANYLLVFFLIGSTLQTLSLRLALPKARIKNLKIDRFNSIKLAAGLKKWGWMLVASFYFPAANFLNIQLSYFLSEGSVSLVSYSSRIPFAISNLVIFAFWTVALPTTHIKRQQEFLDTQIYTRLAKVAILSLIVSLVGFHASPLLVQGLYGLGDGLSLDELGLIDSLQSIYFIALPIQIVASLLLRYLHIMGQAKTTVLICLGGLTAQILYLQFIDQKIQGIALGFLNNYAGVLALLVLFTIKVFIQQKRRGLSES